MIISASRRTDIPAFYSEWFVNRLKEGYVLIPNPRNAGRLSRAELSPDNVDCIVFWTKDPLPMLEKLEQIDAMGYDYYFQFTLTAYGRTVEPNLPSKGELAETLIRLSERIGAERTVWRYDPVIVDPEHTVEWHIRQFAAMCDRLRDHTERCVISFIDPYKNIDPSFRSMTREEMTAIASAFLEIAKKYGISLHTCSEEINLEKYGVEHSACIDRALIERIVGCAIDVKKDANQRGACRCIESVDIGAYDTCLHGCKYCYATSNEKTARRRAGAHDPNHPSLIGYVRGDEKVTDRTAASQKSKQIRLL